MLVTHLGRRRYLFSAGKGNTAIGSYDKNGEGIVDELVSNAKYRPSMANVHNVRWIVKFIPRERLIEILRAARRAAPLPIRTRDLKAVKRP